MGMENMGKQRIVNKAISPAEVVKAMMAGSITTAQAQALFSGVIPIGDYNGIASIYDINKQVIQPLIWAEKQWTEDRVDPRNGMVQITLPVASPVNVPITGQIEVPAGEVWYLCEHEIRLTLSAVTVSDILVNFLVSSFPITIAGTDKPYYLAGDPQVYLATQGGALTPVVGANGIGSLQAAVADLNADDVTDRRLVPAVDPATGIIGAWTDVKRNFRDGDELNTELRLVGGDILTLVATPIAGPVTTAPVIVTLRVWGRVGKLLVS